jgi:hypothetical protein
MAPWLSPQIIVASVIFGHAGSNPYEWSPWAINITFSGIYFAFIGIVWDSSENLERVVWCGEGSIAMGLVENMNPAPEQTPTPKESDRT